MVKVKDNIYSSYNAISKNYSWTTYVPVATSLAPEIATYYQKKAYNGSI